MFYFLVFHIRNNFDRRIGSEEAECDLEVRRDKVQNAAKKSVRFIVFYSFKNKFSNIHAFYWKILK